MHSKHPDHDSQSLKLLGIYLDEHLNFNHNTAKLTCFFINRPKHTLSPKALKILYTSFFHSHLLYCTNVYTCTSQATTIFKQTKKTIHIITGANYLDHTAPLMERTDILPLEKIITYSTAIFMHSVYYEYAQASFENIWTTNAQQHPDLNLRNANNIILPFPRIEMFKSCH
jgi:hypothetical protein